MHEQRSRHTTMSVAAAAIAVGLVLTAGLMSVGSGRAQTVDSITPEAPALTVDESLPSELLVCTRDIPSSHWRDGDVMQVFSAYDALRVHAETITNGRGAYKGDAVPALRTLYDQITDNRRHLPSRNDLLAWWERAETLAGLDREDFARFPFSPLERRSFLVVPLDADVSPALQQRWAGPDGIEQYRLRVDWRNAVTGLAAEADVVSRVTPVHLDTALSATIVTAHAVLADKEEN